MTPYHTRAGLLPTCRALTGQPIRPRQRRSTVPCPRARARRCPQCRPRRCPAEPPTYYTAATSDDAPSEQVGPGRRLITLWCHGGWHVMPAPAPRPAQHHCPGRSPLTLPPIRPLPTSIDIRRCPAAIAGGAFQRQGYCPRRRMGEAVRTSLRARQPDHPFHYECASLTCRTCRSRP
jgi:hypothetical protein